MEVNNNPSNQNFSIDAKLSINGNSLISEVVNQVLKILQNNENFEKDKILANFIPNNKEKSDDHKKLRKKINKIAKESNRVINELDERVSFLEENFVNKTQIEGLNKKIIENETKINLQKKKIKDLENKIEYNRINCENIIREKIENNAKKIENEKKESGKKLTNFEKDFTSLYKKIEILEKSKNINFLDKKVEEIFYYFKKELEDNNINYTPNRLKLKRRFSPEKIIDKKQNFDTIEELLNTITKESTIYPTVFNIYISKLQKKGQDINKFLNSGETPLTNLILKQKTELIKILLKNNADANRNDKKGITPLEYTINNNYIDIAEILLENKANPNAKSEKTNSLVHRAVYLGRPEILLLLLQFGGDCNNDLYCKFWKPVFQAALSNRYLELQIMMDFGVELNCVYNGYTPVLLSSIKGGEYDQEEKQFRLLALLIENGADVEMDYCGKLYQEYLSDKTKLRLKEFRLLRTKNCEF